MSERVVQVYAVPPWPLVTGQKRGSYEFLLSASKLDNVNFLGLWCSVEEKDAWDHLRSHLHLGTRLHLAHAKSHWSPLFGTIMDWLKSDCFYGRLSGDKLLAQLQPDVVHADMFWSSALALRAKNCKKILFVTDHYSKGAWRAIFHSNYFKGKASNVIRFLGFSMIERFVYRGFDTLIVAGAADAQSLGRVSGARTVTYPIPIRAKQSVRAFRDRSKIIIGGNYRVDCIREGTAKFVRLFLQKTQWPKREILILGPGAVQAFGEVANSARAISVRDHAPNWEDILAESIAYVYPQLCGSGMQVKLVEALSQGSVPICAPHIAAGQMVDDFGNGFVFSDYDQLWDRVIALDQNEALYERLASSGRNLIQRHFHPESVTELLKQLYH